MPSTTRRRLGPTLFGLVAVVALLAGCGTGQGRADDYAGLEDNFIEGCEAVAEADAEDSDSAALPDDFCRCAFDALSDPDTGVEFDELMDLNDEFTEDPAALPDSVTEVFADCS